MNERGKEILSHLNIIDIKMVYCETDTFDEF